MAEAINSLIKNKRIFLTGGTGFFGKSLMLHCASFHENSFVVLAPDVDDFINTHPLLLQNKRIEFLTGDVRDFRFPEPSFDYIFHAAATSGKIIPEDEMRSVVIDGTKHVLEFAARNNHLSNFLFISSGAVYGNIYQTPMDENLPCQPVTFYGKTKLEAEKLCLDSDVSCTIARCFAFVGEYLPLDTHFAIGNFINDCLHRRDIIIKGDGTPVRTYLYSGDLANWLWTALCRGAAGRIYNVGSDREISIRRLAETVRKIAGTDNDIKILKPPAGKFPETYIPDISRASHELGLNVSVTLEKAIALTLDYHRQQKLIRNGE